MADRSSEAAHAEPRVFDADPWGASPNWDPEAAGSVYEDDDLDDEPVPLARSLAPDDDPASWGPS